MKYEAVLSAVATMAAVARGAWVPMGELGQSGTVEGEPIAQLSMRVVADGDGNVVFGNGWYAGPGETKARRLSRTVPGVLVGDGRDIYAVTPKGMRMQKVRLADGGLEAVGPAIGLADRDGTVSGLAIAPAGCDKGFCSKAKFAVLDRKEKKVRGFAADGRDVGVLLDYSGHAKAKLVENVGFLPETGDLLLGTGYPEDSARRFAADGMEVVGPFWPSKSPGAYCLADGRVWALASEALELSAAKTKGDRIGFKAQGFDSIAFSAGKFWLGSSQGAMLFDPKHPTECLARVGGTGPVDALMLDEGRVFAFVGPRICQYWLDDAPDEPLASDDRNWMWRVGGTMYSGKVVALEKRGETALLDFVAGGKTFHFAFVWRQELWMKRAERMRRVEGDAATPAPRPADMPEGDFTATAVDGDWMVAYSPSRHAILKFRKR